MNKIIKSILLLIAGALLMLLTIYIFSNKSDDSLGDDLVIELRSNCNSEAKLKIDNTNFENLDSVNELYQFHYDSCIRAYGQEPGLIKSLETNLIYQHE